MTTKTLETNITIFTPKVADYLAFGSLATLVTNLIIITITGDESIFFFLGPLYRVLLIPAVAFLPAPNWAKMAGWLWIFFDSALDIGSINNMDFDLVFQLRMGIHLAFGIWPIAVGWLSNGVHRWSAFLVGIVTAGYSFVAPWVPSWILASTALLLMIYIVISGIKLLSLSAK